MEAMFREIAEYVAVGVEAAAALLIVIGAVQAFTAMLRCLFLRQFLPGVRREIRVHFGAWLLLGLEFEIAADIVRTAISPSWNDIGQLAAIATIRTVLNYFLEKDIEKSRESGITMEPAVPQGRAA